MKYIIVQFIGSSRGADLIVTLPTWYFDFEVVLRFSSDGENNKIVMARGSLVLVLCFSRLSWKFIMHGDNYEQMPAIRFCRLKQLRTVRPLYMYSWVAMYPAPKLCGWLIWTCILHYGSFFPLTLQCFSLPQSADLLACCCCVSFFFSSRVVQQCLLATPRDSSYLPSTAFYHTEHAAQFEWQQPSYTCYNTLNLWFCLPLKEFCSHFATDFCHWLPTHFVAYCCWILMQVFFYFNPVGRGSPIFSLKCSGVKWKFLLIFSANES